MVFEPDDDDDDKDLDRTPHRLGDVLLLVDNLKTTIRDIFSWLQVRTTMYEKIMEMRGKYMKI